uniref:Putative salivary secreted protein n=1 Tax=Ixodes ricinus TaxID=34613 RepID=A0A6B0U906_IXORI
MQGQAKIIICGTLMIVHGILNGVLSQWPPSSSPCYNDVLAVGDIFCTITGQHMCPEGLEKQFDEWKTRWSANKETARTALCDRTNIC